MKPGVRSFTIKGGQCHLYPDRIEIRRSDWVGSLTNFLFRKGYQRAIILYLMLAIGLFLAAVLALLIENYFLASFLLGMGVLAGGTAIVNRDLSFVPVIPKRSIEKTEYRRAIQGEARAAFIIYFRPDRQLLKRVILLPTLTHQGTSLADTAYWMMRDEGLVD